MNPLPYPARHFLHERDHFAQLSNDTTRSPVERAFFSGVSAGYHLVISQLVDQIETTRRNE